MGKGARAKRGFFLAAVLAGLAACAPIVERHGFIPSESDLAQIVPGRSSRAEALEILPPPTVEGPLADGDLYYVYNEFRTMGPFARREVDRQVLAVDVNGAGIVTGLTRYGLRDGRVVPLVQRVTDDNIADVSFIRQLMGSIGRIDPSRLFGG